MFRGVTGPSSVCVPRGDAPKLGGEEAGNTCFKKSATVFICLSLDISLVKFGLYFNPYPANVEKMVSS